MSNAGGALGCCCGSAWAPQRATAAILATAMSLSATSCCPSNSPLCCTISVLPPPNVRIPGRVRCRAHTRTHASTPLTSHIQGLQRIRLCLAITPKNYSIIILTTITTSTPPRALKFLRATRPPAQQRSPPSAAAVVFFLCDRPCSSSQRERHLYSLRTDHPSPPSPAVHRGHSSTTVSLERGHNRFVAAGGQQQQRGLRQRTAAGNGACSGTSLRGVLQGWIQPLQARVHRCECVASIVVFAACRVGGSIRPLNGVSEGPRQWGAVCHCAGGGLDGGGQCSSGQHCG